MTIPLVYQKDPLLYYILNGGNEIWLYWQQPTKLKLSDILDDNSNKIKTFIAFKETFDKIDLKEEFNP